MSVRLLSPRAAGGEAGRGGPDRACGGCEWLHVAYALQLAAKERTLHEALRRIGRLAPGSYEARPIVPSPAALRYRARAKFHLDRESGRLAFFRRRSHEPVRLEECHLLVPGLDALREANRKYTDLVDSIPDGFHAVDGTVLPGIERPATPPKVIVTFVIDGGGWNVLQHWDDPDETKTAWPELKRLMRSSANYRDAIIGTFPAVTACAHATIGTGVSARASARGVRPPLASARPRGRAARRARGLDDGS